MINLDQIQVSEKAKARAKAAGLELDALRESDPERFMLFCAEDVLKLSEDLKGLASSVFFAAFPHHKLFEQTEANLIVFKAFPALTTVEEERLLAALGRLVDHPKFAFPLAYVRTVNDEAGKQHYFALPIAQRDWQGQVNQLVGPFETEDDAQNWGNENVTQGLDFDTLRHADKWFCDVFRL
ncbi:MAG: hypothetical protein KC422_04125 [Trueperaceae bacterium]|nr:hypothetical protein [Trueperaceae bacterium]